MSDLSAEDMCSRVHVRQRLPESTAATTTLADYLHARSVAGMNARELIENVERASHARVTGRFFAFHPRRQVHLLKWLSFWLRKGE